MSNNPFIPFHKRHRYTRFLSSASGTCIKGSRTDCYLQSLSGGGIALQQPPQRAHRPVPRADLVHKVVDEHVHMAPRLDSSGLALPFGPGLRKPPGDGQGEAPGAPLLPAGVPGCCLDAPDQSEQGVGGSSGQVQVLFCGKGCCEGLMNRKPYDFHID
jgi:hypothetical protein